MTQHDPEETVPIRGDGPWTTPSGEPVDLTKPSPEPPTYAPPPTTPHDAAPYAGGPPHQPYQPYQQPGYAYPPVPYVYANRNQGQATTALWLGITGIVGALLTPFCCITLPLLVCSPIAWVLGASARTAIRSAPPGTYVNEGHAQAGFVMGIIGSVLGVLVVVAVAAFFGFAYSI